MLVFDARLLPTAFCGSQLLHIQPPNGSPINSLGLRLGANPKSSLPHVLLSNMDYYNGKRVEQGRADIAGAEAAGRILCRPILGRLHYQYVRA